MQAKKDTYLTNFINSSVFDIPIKKIPGLPINEKWEDIKELIKKNQVIIISGETGSGKTTQIPKICLEAGRGKRKRIVCTQPRRIAATSVARRVSEELGSEYSHLVGFKIRFNDKTSPHTKIKFVTDGILLSEFKNSPLLLEYDTIIIDEAHERSLNIDFLLGIMKRILPKRKDLCLIISSATIDTQFFSDSFDKAPVISVSGRGHPVEIIYDDFEGEGYKDLTLVEKTVLQIEKIHKGDPFGDILVFLPTERDIIHVFNELKSLNNVVVLPLFSRLSQSEQQKIFMRSQNQKIVLATNIAETSITVPGIKYVVDSGLARISHYNWRTGVKSLIVMPISKSSANQRAGRAGRICPGKCYRLYSLEDFEKRDEWSKPEILRANLSEVLLKIIDLNLCKIEDFPFLTTPSSQLIREGKNTLKEINAIDDNEELTEIGKILCELPIDPRLGRMIIQAKSENALKEIIIIASALSIQDPRERPIGREDLAEKIHKKFRDERSDFLTLLNIWNEFENFSKNGASRRKIMAFCEENFLSYNRMMEWKDILNQIHQIIKEKKWYVNTDNANYDAIHRSILSGFLCFISQHQEENRYKGAKGKEISIFPGSSLYKKRPKWIVSTDLMRTTLLYARLCAEIEPQWIVELAHNNKKFHYYNPHFDKKRGEVVAFERIIVFGLTIIDGVKKSYGKIDPMESRRIFINEGIIPMEIGFNFNFIQHNRRVLEEINDIENRLRNKAVIVDNGQLLEFYQNALKILEEKSGITHIHNTKDLEKAIRLCGDDCLRIEKDRFMEMIDHNALLLYPGSINIKNHQFNLIYRFSPDSEGDGITVQIPHHKLKDLDEEPFRWLVPGFFQEKVYFLLKKIPSEYKKRILPLNQTSEAISKKIFNPEKILSKELCSILMRDFGIKISEDLFVDDDLPHHLIMKYEILDNSGRVIDQGRDFGKLKGKWVEKGIIINKEQSQWKNFRERFEKEGLNINVLPDYPDFLMYHDTSLNINIPVYPSLVISSNQNSKFSIRLFQNKEEARKNTNETVRIILKNNLKREIQYIRDKIEIKRLSPELIFHLRGKEKISENIINFLMANLLGDIDNMPKRDFLIEKIRNLEKNFVPESIPIINKINYIFELLLQIWEEIKKIQNYFSNFKKNGSPDNIVTILTDELKSYLPENFPENLSISYIEQLPRYLKALQIRVSRAYSDPKKDKIKWGMIKPYLQLFEEIKKNAKINNSEKKDDIENLKKMIEEFKISVFAPEIKSTICVSPKRLDDLFNKLKNN